MVAWGRVRAALSRFFHTRFRNSPVLFSAPVDTVLLFITFYFLFFGKCTAVKSGAGGRTEPKQCIQPAPPAPPPHPLHSVMREDPEMPSVCFPSSDLSKEPSDSYNDEIFLCVLLPCTHQTKECSFFQPWVGFEDGTVNVRKPCVYLKLLSESLLSVCPSWP